LGKLGNKTETYDDLLNRLMDFYVYDLCLVTVYWKGTRAEDCGRIEGTLLRHL